MKRILFQLNFFVLFFPTFSSRLLFDTPFLERKKKHHLLATWAQKKAIPLNSQELSSLIAVISTHCSSFYYIITVINSTDYLSSLGDG